MRARNVSFLAALTAVAAFVACTLNPQPLPPIDSEMDSPGGDFGAADAATRPPDDSDGRDSDAGVGSPDGGSVANPDAGDAGDADADAGDADAGDAGD